MSQKLRCLVIGIPEAKAAEGSLRPEEFASIPLEAFESMLPLPEALELVAYKASAHETAAVPADVDARHRANWPRLEAFIDAAKARSPLPAAPANEAACEAWLIERRMMQLG